MGVELLEVGARRDHRHLLWCVVVVKLILTLDLIPRAGDHQLSTAQGIFLSADPRLHVIALLDLLDVHAHGKQASVFVATEGVTGVNQRQAGEI